MRVGVVTDFYFPWIAGPSMLVRNLSRGLASRGHSVSVLAPSPAGGSSSELDGNVVIKRSVTAPIPVGYGLRVSIRPFHDTSAWLDEFKPDVVHVHHPFPLSTGAVLTAGARGIPVVSTNHTVPECSLWGLRNVPLVYPASTWAFARWIVWLNRRCRQVATPTATAAAALVSMGYHGTIHPVSNGIDTQRFAPGRPDRSLRVRLGLDDRPIVLYTGRLDPDKQMGLWLRAAGECEEDAQFVVGGRGTDRERLERLARELGIESRVRFIGYVPDDDLPALYRLADIYFITSPVELQSITTLEALASGVPAVAVDALALPELVHDGDNGFLVAPQDHDRAAAALSLLIRDESLRARMADASRAIALKHDLSRTLDSYEALFRDAITTERGDQRLERTAPAES